MTYLLLPLREGVGGGGRGSLPQPSPLGLGVRGQGLSRQGWGRFGTRPAP
jgi:hypothetical protein